MTQRDIEGVKNAINRYLNGYVEKNIDAIEDAILQSNDTIGIGTDENELWRGWAEIKSATERQLKAFSQINFKRGKTITNFSDDGTVAWFAEELSGKICSGKSEHTCHIRFTGILEKRNNKWEIVQFHRSIPVVGCCVPYLETHGVRFD
ncbi:MAG: hypothetical protein COS89_02570 [Deltaproteobacteria bacterium CG07_land_8_20_14_0_80_38_7]|nr:MAG: hypothetical protein COS89_02570 [Deltaproteobacteria bacterium CG07_land_8_20_14_0_80_38_7]